jgi:hypothetical protein
MKSAVELLDDLLRHTMPPSGCAISVTESEPRDSADVNWTAAAGVMDQPSLDRYSRKLDELRKSDPIVDWSAVLPNPSGERKSIAKWYSELSGS